MATADPITRLPVQHATRFPLALNLRTATALGLEFPPQLLALANIYPRPQIDRIRLT